MKVHGFKPVGADVTPEFEDRLEYGVISITSRMADARWDVANIGEAL